MGLFENLSNNTGGQTSRFFSGLFSPSPLLSIPSIVSSGFTDRQAADIREGISNISPYEIPESARKLEDIYGTAADEILGLKDIYKKATGLAKSQTNLSEAPGMGILKGDVRESTASTIQNLKESGGSSASVMGAIAEAGNNEMKAVRQIGRMNQEYRARALENYRNALTSEAQGTAGLISTAAGLEGRGLETMLQQEALRYGYGRQTEEDLLNFDIIQLSNQMSENERNSANRNETINNLLQFAMLV